MADWLGEGGILERVGDAFAGVDRDAAFRKGQYERAQYDTQLTMQDENRAQTESALATARERTAAATQEERINEIRRQIELDPSKLVNYGDPETIALVLGGGYGNYEQAMAGQTHRQGQIFRDDIANPATPEAVRGYTERALSPSSAVSAAMGQRTPHIVRGPNGDPIHTADWEGGVAMTALSPNGSGGDGKIGDDFFPQEDTNTLANLAGRHYGGIYNPETGNYLITDPSKNAIALRAIMVASQLMQVNAGMPHALAMRLATTNLDAFPDPTLADFQTGPEGQPAPPDPWAEYMQQIGPVQPGELMSNGLPQGAQPVAHTRDGKVIYELPGGERVVLE